MHLRRTQTDTNWIRARKRPEVIFGEMMILEKHQFQIKGRKSQAKTHHLPKFLLSEYFSQNPIIRLNHAQCIKPTSGSWKGSEIVPGGIGKTTNWELKIFHFHVVSAENTVKLKTAWIFSQAKSSAESFWAESAKISLLGTKGPESLDFHKIFCRCHEICEKSKW